MSTPYLFIARFIDQWELYLPKHTKIKLASTWKLDECEIHKQELSSFIPFESVQAKLWIYNSLGKLPQEGQWFDLQDLESFTGHQGHFICQLIGSCFPFMPSPISRVRLPLKSQIEWKKNSLCFFGGSFWPWHQGHEECLKRYPNEDIWIIPDRNPFKPVVEYSCPWAYYKELKQKINTPIYPGFIGLAKKNPTINWIAPLQENAPHLKLRWLMGFDSLKSLPNWKNSQVLLTKLESVYYLARNEDDQQRKQVEEIILKMAPHLKIVFLGQHPFEQISSTQIRKEGQ